MKLVIISTTPDRRPETPLGALGGDKGLFVAEVEQAIRDGRADAAVHSLKDVPGDLPEDMELVALPERADPRDALLTRANVPLNGLPQGAHVGTSALRRRGQLLRLRPDLRISEVRGNVDTRVRKLREGQFDAMLLASAGLDRLGLDGEIAERLPFEKMLCAAGQGAMAVEAPVGTAFSNLWRQLDNAEVRTCIEAERTFVRAIGADCNSAAGCLCEVHGEEVRLRAVVISSDGAQSLNFDEQGLACATDDLAMRAAEEMLRQGARAILSQ